MIYAVIFAGGVGTRMKSDTPKQFMEVHGKTVIAHTIDRFEKHNLIDGISVVCLAGWIEEMKNIIRLSSFKKVKYIVPGAETGQQSIYNGLKAIHDDSFHTSNDIVLINDGVRPFVSGKIISECIKCVKKFGSAVVTGSVVDTIGIAEKYSGKISDIPDRKLCCSLKAPQAFFLDDIINTHHMAMTEGKYCFTNSAELCWHYGMKIYTVPDEGTNFKITTQADLELMKILIPKWLKEDDELNG